MMMIMKSFVSLNERKRKQISSQSSSLSTSKREPNALDHLKANFSSNRHGTVSTEKMFCYGSSVTSGESYKRSAIVIYVSRVISISNLPVSTSLES